MRVVREGVEEGVVEAIGEGLWRVERKVYDCSGVSDVVGDDWGVFGGVGGD